MPVNILPPSKWSGRSDPEDGPLALRLHHLVKDDATRAIIGFASEAGVIRNLGRKGAHDGPAALRKALSNLPAPKNATTFTDLGDVEVVGDSLEGGQAALADKICGALGKFEHIVVLGGGHETAFASFSGLAQKYPDKQIGIINLDAHLDIRLPSERGPSSGTPFAQIRELAPEKFDYLCIGVADESNTTALIKRVEDWGVNIITDHQLINDKHAANAAIEAIINRSDLIYLTIDLDVMPHYQAPGVSAPAARGVAFEIIEQIVDNILRTCNALDRDCPLTDVVELSPPNDPLNVTARTAALLIRQMLFFDCL